MLFSYPLLSVLLKRLKYFLAITEFQIEIFPLPDSFWLLISSLCLSVKLCCFIRLYSQGDQLEAASMR